MSFSARMTYGLLPAAGLLLALLLAGCRGAGGPAAEAVAVKLLVDTTGAYEVSASALKAAGIDLANSDPAALTLSSGGQPVAFLVTGTGRNRALRFYGQALGPAAHTAQNVYWLAKQAPGAAQPGVSMPTRAAAPRAGVAATTTVSATVRAEEQKQWVPDVGLDDDRWIWQTVFAPAETKVTLSIPSATGAEATLRVGVWARSSAPVEPDHHWTLAVNGTAVADASWDGLAAHIITATIPPGVLRSGENQLTIRAPGDTGADADSVMLDWVEVRYTRELAVAETELTFAGAAPAYAIKTKAAPVAVWDITDPARPISLQNIKTAQGSILLAAPPEGGDRRYIVVGPQGLRSPAAIKAAPGPDGQTAQRLRVWPDGADLLIITVPRFRDTLAPLVKARQAQGLRVAVIDIEDVYDTFSYGRTDPAALRDLISQAVAHWPAPAPRYVLLAGDASYDPRGYLKASEADLIPTYLVLTPHSGWTASDGWLALPASSEVAPSQHPKFAPLVAIGRFPAQTSEQLAIMVAKTLEYERVDPATPWRRRSLMIADNDESDFTLKTQAFASALKDYEAQVLTVDKGGATRAALLKAFADGVGIVGYIGHGSLSLWAQEKILSVDDVAKLEDRDRLPLVLTLTCLSGFFHHPTNVSLGEAFLRTPNVGAAAVIAPTSASLLVNQTVLADGLAQAFSAPETKTIGEVLWGAQKHLVATPSGINEILLTFNLLGDPAMRIK